MNRWIGSGNLTKDPEIRFTNNGTAVVNFTLGINVFKKGGEKETVYIDFTAWSKLAEIVSNYAHKGDRLLVEGELSQDKWEEEGGAKRSKTYVTCHNIELPPKNSGGSNYSAPASTASTATAPAEDDSDFPF